MNHVRHGFGVVIKTVLVNNTKKYRVQIERTVLLGTIVKFQEQSQFKDKLLIKILKDDNESWEDESFICEKSHVAPIYEEICPFLAYVSLPLDRVKLAKNSELCEALANVSVNSSVVFTDNDIYIGIVKYKGQIKGVGKGYGIHLHERRPESRCDGSCAGIRYFECEPGSGLFTTIEKIIPFKYYTNHNSDKVADNYLQNIITSSKSSELYQQEFKNGKTCIKNIPSNASQLKTSVSLQNIYDATVNVQTKNSNNDFDQNSIIQKDKSHLLREKQGQRFKSYLNADCVDRRINQEIEELNKVSTSEKNKDFEERNKFNAIHNGPSKETRNKSSNIMSHLVNGSKTLPKRNKAFESRSTFYLPYDRDEKLNNKENGCSTYDYDVLPSTSTKKDSCLYYPPDPGTTKDFSIGSLVEIANDISKEPLYGVIRWMGVGVATNQVLVGVELEEEQTHLPLNLTDGTHNGKRYFKCAENRGIFVNLEQCQKDSRFVDGTPTPSFTSSDKTFGKDCPIIEGMVAPLCMPTEEDVEAVCGKFRGIQGHHNSCYLDATLFAMFTFTSVFDSLLFRPKNSNDIPRYEEIQRVLREEIVNPLRSNLYVRADRVMDLRKLLDQLSSVSGMTTEEKDPEEFLNCLLAQTLKAEPFLKLNSGQESYYYQLFVEKDDGLSLPTVQQLFEQSFLSSDIKLKEVPSCLIIQMPRFGKNYKMYPRILPSQLLDVTDIIDDSPRQCTVCGTLAKWECKECFGDCEEGLASTAFCENCLKTAHTHRKRSTHNPRPLSVLQDYVIMTEHCPPPRLFMELFAVVCIETSHYVSFVKCGAGHEAPWCFFDSMADRKGEQNGYNIPEMVACPDVSKMLSDEHSCRLLHENCPSDRFLPEYARRLLCDAYICMYQSPDVMMYK